MRNSLRVQLLVGLLVPLAVVLLVLVSIAYRTAAMTAQTVTDRLLLGSARSIADQVHYGENGMDAVIPPAALSMFDFGSYDTVYYRVTSSDGRLLAGYSDLPVAPRTVTEAHPEFYDATFHDDPVRLVAVRQVVPAPGRTLWATIVVGETLNDRDALLKRLWIGNAEQQAVLVLIASGLAWFALRRGLSPLLRFSGEVAERQPDEFRPFSAAGVQTELRPLVNALNAYMMRLRAQLEAQRRFTANAAHQLRTPLTLLRTQVVYALRSATEDEPRETARALLATTRQMTRLTNQLLSLARVEPDGHTAPGERVDLADLTREILEEYGRLAVDREVDLAFDETAAPGTAVTRADAGMMRDLVVNIVDNAVRATPAGGLVSVSVERDGDACVVRVEDTGPGIPAAERERVFERFYRMRSNDSEGSGLGLAIVKEIVTAHGGTITLDDRSAGPGLVFEVRLPADDAVEPSGSDVAEGGGTPPQEPALHPG